MNKYQIPPLMKTERAMYNQVCKMRQLTVPAWPVCCHLWCVVLSWMNFAKVIWTSVSLFPGPSSPGSWYLLHDASAKLPQPVLKVLLRSLCFWFYSPYTKYPLSLVTHEKSWSVPRGRDEQRNTVGKVTGRGSGGANRVWRVWREERAVLCFFSLPALPVGSTANTGLWK